uniref:Uncharacterized protein n=2 Tax=Caenorhabditis tropicalis TaxID=1561998 RepID=A0A1I7V3T2_9PELO
MPRRILGELNPHSNQDMERVRDIFIRDGGRLPPDDRRRLIDYLAENRGASDNEETEEEEEELEEDEEMAEEMDVMAAAEGDEDEESFEDEEEEEDEAMDDVEAEDAEAVENRAVNRDNAREWRA